MPNKIFIPKIDLNSSFKKAQMSALYGIGIAQAGAMIAAETVFKNSGLLEKIYNIKSDDYSPDAYPDGNGGYATTDRWDGRMSSSLSGMPVMCYLKIIGGDYLDLKGNVITIPEISFETVVLSLSMGRDLEIEKITGRDAGSIKEFINIGDWDVEIRAIITSDSPVNNDIQKYNQDGRYPRDNMAEIFRVLKAPIALAVECWYLEQFEIRYLVIKDGIKIEQVEGEYSTQRITIPCLSDNPLIIKIFE